VHVGYIIIIISTLYTLANRAWWFSLYRLQASVCWLAVA